MTDKESPTPREPDAGAPASAGTGSHAEPRDPVGVDDAPRGREHSEALPALEPTREAEEIASAVRSPWWSLPVLALVAAVFFHSVRPSEREQQFEIDEAEWLTISIQSWRQLTGDISPLAGLPAEKLPLPEDANLWKLGIHQSTFGFMNPMLPKFLFGALASAGGHDQYSALVYPRFGSERPIGKERAKQMVVPPRRSARLLVLGLWSLTAALLALCLRPVAGWPGALVGLVLFCASPNVQDAATRVRTDVFPLCLGLLALYWAQRMSQHIARGRVWSALGLGLCAGLAVGSKLNGALVAFCVGAYALLSWLCVSRNARTPFVRGPLRTWLLAGGLCCALFMLFSPHLWPAPIEGLRDLSASWEGDIEHQKDRYGERLGRADDLAGHIKLGLTGALGEDEPLRALTGAPLGAGAMLIGMVGLLLALTGRIPTPSRTALALLLAYLLIMAVGTTLWLPFGRRSFFLPYGLLAAMLEGAAFGLVWHFARQRLQRSRKLAAQ